MKAVIIPPERFEEFLPAYLPWIVKAAENTKGRMKPEEYAFFIVSGQHTLWTFWDDAYSQCFGAIAAEIVGKVGVVRWIGGVASSSWRECFPKMEEWAAQQGATSVRYEGRKAWQKLMPDYAVVEYVFEKILR